MEGRDEEMYQGKWSIFGYFQSHGHVVEGICCGMKPWLLPGLVTLWGHPMVEIDVIDHGFNHG